MTRLQKWRDENPEKYAYNNLKSNSKRRNKDFDLSFEEFKQFCYECDYIGKKGRKKKSLSIDRIENEKGYSIDNIQAMTLSDNSKKYVKKMVCDKINENATVVKYLRVETCNI